MKHFRQALTADKRAGLAILVAALGYFVDIYDLVLFTIVRVASLRGIGVSAEGLLPEGVFLLNMQMIGMLLGGLLWGILGDKRGRVFVLFGSILTYSLANIANAFVTDVWQYAACRLIAGIGLAGEIGAGVTLVAEIMPKGMRGYGTTLIAVIGLLGTLAAGVIGDLVDWQTAYIVGGVMGLLLLALRVGVHESGLYHQTAERSNVRQGDVMLILASPSRLARYAVCVVAGVPIWFLVGIVVTFTPEFGVAMGMTEPLKASWASMLCYAGMSVGNLLCGMLSEYWRSRKRAMGVFLAFAFAMSMAILLLPLSSPLWYYALCVPLGFGGGFWVVYLTGVAEQFGTNLRATVTTTVPNFVRGSTVLMTLGFSHFKDQLGVIGSAAAVGAVFFSIGLIALLKMRESYGADLDFVEDRQGILILDPASGGGVPETALDEAPRRATS